MLKIIVPFLFLSIGVHAQAKLSDNKKTIFRFGGLERADTTKQIIYLTFTGGDYNDGGTYIRNVLKHKKTKAQFFFTGDFFRQQENKHLINNLISDGHYLGPHSDKHLLYAPWENRDSLLVSEGEFKKDLNENIIAMESFGLTKEGTKFFMPPYEWYNQQISDWTNEMSMQLVNFSPGTRSNADYTTPDMGKNYISSEAILKRIFQYEQEDKNGLNGFILLLHIGTHSDRTDKFYYNLEKLIDELRTKGYQFNLIKDDYSG